MAPKLTTEERAHIVDLLREHGGNQNKVAKLCGRSQDTVRRIALSEGIQSVKRIPKKALEVKAAVQEIDRMEVISLGLETGTELLRSYKGRKATIENIRAYKDLMTGIAIGIDKHRLETGEATSRSENVDPAEAARRQRMRENLDEVAAQRRKRVG